MNNQENEEIYYDLNSDSIRIVLRAIDFSQGQLSLLLLKCNYAQLRQKIVAEIHAVSSFPIREIRLSETTKSLARQISEALGDEQPQAVMVSGLDSVKNIDTILILSNQIRDELRNNFNFPILIWIDNQILKKFIRLAPDLENWGSIIDFESDTDDLVDLLQNTTEEIFNQDVTPTPQVYREIESARQDLEQRGETINPETEAGLNLVFGLREYQQNNLDDALIYYQQSLEFWQSNQNLERCGIVLVKIALVYNRKAEISKTDNQENWQNARDYLQQAIDVFEQTGRLDLLVQYNHQLGEVLRNLKAWNELENIAHKSIKLYQQISDSISLQDEVKNSASLYGFLAEAALEKQDYQKAKEYSQQGLDILANIPNLPSQEFGLYRLFLARSQVGLREISTGIQTLETAKKESHPQYNPQLYIDILKELNTLYF